MSNPASDLHAIFTRWSTSPGDHHATNYSAAQLRQLENGGSPDFSEHFRAARLLSIVQVWLQQAEQDDPSLTVYGQYLQVWSAAIFNYPHAWTSSGGDKPFEPPMMHMLQVLGSIMQARGVIFDKSRTQSLSELLRSIEDQAVADTSLPADLTDFLRSTARTLRETYTDYSRFGNFDFKLACKALKVALDLAAEKSTQKKSFWTNARDEWVSPISIGALGGIVSEFVMRAIGS